MNGRIHRGCIEDTFRGHVLWAFAATSEHSQPQGVGRASLESEVHAAGKDACAQGQCGGQPNVGPRLAVMAASIGLVMLLASVSLGGTIDGTLIRSFESPLGSSTYGIAMDSDGVHAWINARNGIGELMQMDLFGNEVLGTLANVPALIPQGFEMDADGLLWYVDRSSNNENAVQITTDGTFSSSFPLQDGGGFFDNPNDLTLRDGDLYVVAPLDAGMHRFEPDGTFVETIDFESGALDPDFASTDAITYDGMNFWVAFGSFADNSLGSMVFEIAPDGSVLSSFAFADRLLGLSYDPTNDHLLATNGNISETIFVIGSGDLLCSEINRIRARCVDGGVDNNTLGARVLVDGDHDGEEVTVEVDGVPITATIIDGVASIELGGQLDGSAHSIYLSDPNCCGEVQVFTSARCPGEP